MNSQLLDNRADLAQTIEAVTEGRMAEGDTASEIGPHLAGAVLDLVLPVVAGDLLALDLMEETLKLVDWAKVAQKEMDRLEGVDRWKI